MGRTGYPAEFRRRALDLVESGRTVTDVARDLAISEQSIYRWRRQDRIDRGLEPGTPSTANADLIEARRHIAKLEAELAIAQIAIEQLTETADPKGGSQRST